MNKIVDQLSSLNTKHYVPGKVNGPVKKPSIKLI